MAKVRIRKLEGRWTSTIPGIGFTGQDRTQHHPTHAAAIAAHTTTPVSSGSVCAMELAYQPVDQATIAHIRPVYW